MELDLLAKWLVYMTYFEGRFGRRHPLLQSCKHELSDEVNKRLAKNRGSVTIDTFCGVIGLITAEVRTSRTTLDVANAIQNAYSCGPALDHHLDGLRQLYDTIGRERLDQAGILQEVLS